MNLHFNTMNLYDKSNDVISICNLDDYNELYND